LRSQLGHPAKEFRLWQDKEAIAPGRLWEEEIKAAVEQSVFFIPIVTPTAVRSSFCRFEFESFLAREQALRRSDLIFPSCTSGFRRWRMTLAVKLNRCCR